MRKLIKQLVLTKECEFCYKLYKQKIEINQINQNSNVYIESKCPHCNKKETTLLYKNKSYKNKSKKNKLFVVRKIDSTGKEQKLVGFFWNTDKTEVRWTLSYSIGKEAFSNLYTIFETSNECELDTINEELYQLKLRQNELLYLKKQIENKS